MNLQQQLRKYLREDGDWVSKGLLLRMTWKNEKNFTTYIPASVDRALRTLEVDKKIAVKYEGKNTMYHFLPESKKEDYIPTSERTGSIYWKSKLT